MKFINLLFYTYLLLALIFFSCSTKHPKAWRKMDCGLYMSPEGDIGYATIPKRANVDHSELKSEECPNYFLTTFGYDDTTQLKYVIDTVTFKEIGSNLYQDSNTTYDYYPMCDGGYFNQQKNSLYY